MAWRETRAAWVRLLFFFVCVAHRRGRDRRASQRRAERARTRSRARRAQIVGADIVVQSPRPWTAEVRATLERDAGGRRRVTRTEVIETRTMAAPRGGQGHRQGPARRAARRRGRVSVLRHASNSTAARRTRTRCSANCGALVPPEFLLEMGLAVGDTVRLGGRPFTIRGVVDEGSRAARRRRIRVRSAPVSSALDDLRALGLLGFGSSATYQTFLQGRRARHRRPHHELRGAVRTRRR